ncbi:MAG: cell wall hydrolase [Clostridia bacterium]|nr:cell wall hydrolase [Clostridia bacterium]
MAYSDRELLARLIQCEAGGEGDNGMKAVASVVMNRVETRVGEYGRTANTIRNAIFQKGQFTCAMETVGGRYNSQNLYNSNPTEQQYEIADWAIAGNRLPGLGSALWFFNPYSDSCPSEFPSAVGSFALRVGNHCFYNPTARYAST